MTVRVKICGVTSVRDARMVARSGADAVGLNFHPPSPRCVDLETAEAIVSVLPPGVCRVGVFVDKPRDEVRRLARRLRLDALQFHGDEDAEYCRGWDLKVIKAVRVRDSASLARTAAYPVDFILADAYVKGSTGGTGRQVRWDWLVGVERERLILAGGLTAENVSAAVRQVHPFAVDVASGVESAPGQKDPRKVRDFIAHARAARP